MISETELAWLAGFIDGEGYIGIEKRLLRRRATPEYTIVLQISNTKRGIISFLKDLSGGSFYTYKPKGKAKLAYKWTIKAKAAESILAQLVPYLRLKREQAELALELARELSWPRGYDQAVPKYELEKRERLYQMIKILNRRGKAGLEQGFQTELVTERTQQPKMI